MTDERVGPLFEAFDDALAERDLDRAREYALRIENAEPPHESLLGEIETALEAGQDDRARTLLHTASRRFAEEEAAEERAFQRTLLAQATGEELTGADRRELTRHARQLAAASATRSSFLGTAGAFLRGDEQPEADRAEVIRTVQRERVREATATEATQEGIAVTEELTLPASLTVLSVRSPAPEFVIGQTKPLHVTVGNVGDEPAEDVALELSATDGLDIESETVDIGTLDGDVDERVEIGVTSDEPGEYSVSVSAASQTAGTDGGEFGFAVYEEAPTVAFALDESDTGIIDTEEIQQALWYYEHGEPVPNTNEHQLTTEDVRELIVMWANDQPV